MSVWRGVDGERVVSQGVTFEVGADVTGASMRVDVQMPDRRVQVLFGRYDGSFLMLWLSDPAAIADLASKLIDGGQHLSRALAAEPEVPPPC